MAVENELRGAGEVETNGAHYEVVGGIAINVPRSWKLAVIAAQTLTAVHRLKML